MMKTRQEVVGEALWARMSSTYKDWVDQDRYGHVYAHDTGLEISSFRQALGFIFGHSYRGELRLNETKVTCNLDMKVQEVLTFSVLNREGQLMALKDVVFGYLCVAAFAPLVHMISEIGEDETPEEYDAFLASIAGAYNAKSITALCLSPKNKPALIQGLQDLFMERLGDRSLGEFFEVNIAPNGYRSWWDGAFSDAGEPQEPRAIKTEHGTVTLELSLYTDAGGSDIRPYEWQALLCTDPLSAQPDAIACGMVYVLPRYEGALDCSPVDLCWAADTVESTYATQVMSFLAQHQDANELLHHGDLCVLGLWERKEDSQKGLGAEVLEAALKELRHCFPRVCTLVYNSRPAQFFDEAFETDPAEIQVARMEAKEKLEQVIEKLAPQQWLGAVLRGVSNPFDSYDDSTGKLIEMDANTVKYMIGQQGPYGQQ